MAFIAHLDCWGKCLTCSVESPKQQLCGLSLAQEPPPPQVLTRSGVPPPTRRQAPRGRSFLVQKMLCILVQPQKGKEWGRVGGDRHWMCPGGCAGSRIEANVGWTGFPGERGLGLQ